MFLDRDGTVIEHVHYLRDPAHVQLIPRAADAIRLLREAGYACVLVTNQSAIGRGLLTTEGFQQVHEELVRQLRDCGAELDGMYFCPVVPVEDAGTLAEHPDRKPEPGMLLRAAREMRLQLRGSWMVGDMLTDALAGRKAGCRGTILVKTGCEVASIQVDGIVDHVVESVFHAARLIVELDGSTPAGGRRIDSVVTSEQRKQ